MLKKNIVFTLESDYTSLTLDTIARGTVPAFTPFTINCCESYTHRIHNDTSKRLAV